MKNAYTRVGSTLAALVAGHALFAAAPEPPKPPVLTPPTAKEGAEVRAPLPSARQFEDVTAPNPKTFERAPESMPATTPPPSNVRIKVQPPPAPAPADVPLPPTGRVAVPLARGLETAKFAPSIRGTAIGAREQLVADVESRLKSAEAAVGSLSKSASEMSAEGQKQFKAASDEVKDKAKALRKSAQAARKASEKEWDAARTQLAADYEAYAAALARIDAAAGLSAK